MSIKSYAVISGAAGELQRIAVELKNQNYSLCLPLNRKTTPGLWIL